MQIRLSQVFGDQVVDPRPALFVFRAAHEGNLESAGFPSSEKAAYGISKAGQIAITRIHQRTFDQNSRPDILVNSCTPGYEATDMTSHLGTLTMEQGEQIVGSFGP